MSRSNHFPDVREFRTRLRSMGFLTGADGGVQTPPLASASPRRRRTTGATVFWGSLGAGAASVLAWLVVDLGGPASMATALYSAGGSTTQWAALRQDLQQLTTERVGFSPSRDDELRTLRRRVVMLEGMLTGRTAGAAAVARAPAEVIAGAPRATAAIPAPKPALSFSPRFAPLSNKVDLPDQTFGQKIESQIIPMNMASAPDSARRSRLAPATVLGLDLGAYESIEVLKQRWNLVEGRHRDILAGLSPMRITEFSADGRVAHRLIAGPLKDAMDVASRCASLQARSVPCRQTQAGGEPL